MSDARALVLDYMSKTNPGAPAEWFEADDLFEAGLLDSLGLVDLVSHLERSRGIRITAAETVLANFRSVDAMVRFVESKERGAG